MFIPISAGELDILTGDIPVRKRRAYTVTPQLLDELGYSSDMVEDAEYAAMVLASIAGLSTFGERIVVVAEVDATVIEPGEDSANGECLLLTCPPEAMISWFVDAPGTRLPRIPQGISIDDAWSLPEVQTLLTEHDLLWNDVVEYRRA